MNKPDYDKLMIKRTNELGGVKANLLLHSCCAPCSSACLLRLKEHFNVTVLYYNPNICGDEYFKRKEEQIRFLKETGWADFMDCEHNEEEFYSAVKGLENEPEGGRRCGVCFKLRLEKTAALARERGFDFFATTLTVSPLKNSALINSTGANLGEKYGVEWLYSDFKKRDGYKLSCGLAKEYNLYRQNYCGCVFSER